MATNGVQQAKGAALSKPQNRQFKTWLIGKLAQIAMAQQAHVDAETLEYFAEMLSASDPQDLLAATTYFCHRERQQGETAFPSLPALEGAVRDAKNKRLGAEREEHERVDAIVRMKHFVEHPEEYLTLGEIYNAVVAKRKAAGKPFPELLKPGTRKKVGQ